MIDYVAMSHLWRGGARPLSPQAPDRFAVQSVSGVPFRSSPGLGDRQTFLTVGHSVPSKRNGGLCSRVAIKSSSMVPLMSRPSESPSALISFGSAGSSWPGCLDSACFGSSSSFLPSPTLLPPAFQCSPGGFCVACARNHSPCPSVTHKLLLNVGL